MVNLLITCNFALTKSNCSIKYKKLLELDSAGKFFHTRDCIRQIQLNISLIILNNRRFIKEYISIEFIGFIFLQTIVELLTTSSCGHLVSRTV